MGSRYKKMSTVQRIRDLRADTGTAATDSARTANTHQVPCQAHALIEVAEFMRFTCWTRDACRPHGVRFHSPTEKHPTHCASFRGWNPRVQSKV